MPAEAVGDGDGSVGTASSKTNGELSAAGDEVVLAVARVTTSASASDWPSVAADGGNRRKEDGQHRKRTHGDAPAAPLP